MNDNNLCQENHQLQPKYKNINYKNDKMSTSSRWNKEIIRAACPCELLTASYSRNEMIETAKSKSFNIHICRSCVAVE